MTQQEHGSIRLTIVPDELEAEMICGMLRSEGIECEQRVAHMGSISIFGALPGSAARGSGGFREVLVADDDAPRARELLTQAAADASLSDAASGTAAAREESSSWFAGLLVLAGSLLITPAIALVRQWQRSRRRRQDGP